MNFKKILRDILAIFFAVTTLFGGVLVSATGEKNNYTIGKDQCDQVKKLVCRPNLLITWKRVVSCMETALSEPICYNVIISELFERLCFCHVNKNDCSKFADNISNHNLSREPKYQDNYVFEILKIIYILCVKSNTTIVIYLPDMKYASEDSVWNRVAHNFCASHPNVFQKFPYGKID